MIEINTLLNKITHLKEAVAALKNSLDYDQKKNRLIEIARELIEPTTWQDLAKQQALKKEQATMEITVMMLESIANTLRDNEELLAMIANEDPSEQNLATIETEIAIITDKIGHLEFESMFSGSMDQHNTYLDIQAGSGGTEAQDWAEMLMRMYLKFGDRHEFKIEILEVSPGEVAGIKSATIKFSGSFAYGWLRTESGVHRLVRKSPFDANHKRHTSFASVFVYPEVDEEIKAEINPADLRIDTYRAQGAGGQHVNKTDSAVRIKHNLTGIIVQCQSERSQQQNRLRAMKQLRAKLYEIELRKQQEKKSNLEASKLEITWGSQIRSYTLDDSRIKDLRTNMETRNTQAVLDGNLDLFIKENLRQ